MIGTFLALAATVVQALPEEVGAAATQAAAGAAHGGINYLDLMLRASLPVKLIVLLLLAGSLISWVIIFRKLEKKDLIAMGVGAVIVILGYCIAAWNIYGWVAVPMEFVGDILQTSFGIASAYAFLKALRRVKPDLFEKK